VGTGTGGSRPSEGYDTEPSPPPNAVPAPTIAPAPSENETVSERPSKTRLKQAMHDLQDLGEALVALPDDRIQALHLPEILQGAVQEYRRTRSHEGRRRQMQYIGKLMRRVDPEPIRAAVAAMRLGPARDALALHQAEDWRRRLIESDDAATAWAGAFPKGDLQQLRSLVRAARKDAAATPEQRSGRAYRELFRFISRQAEESEP
jgi:ribosome-associated protein